MAQACHCQAARSRLSRRLTIVRSQSSFAEDSEDSMCPMSTISVETVPGQTSNLPARGNATARQGRWPKLATVKQLGPGCRGGSLSLQASRRSPKTQTLHVPQKHHPSRGDSRTRRLRKTQARATPSDGSLTSSEAPSAGKANFLWLQQMTRRFPRYIPGRAFPRYIPGRAFPRYIPGQAPPDTFPVEPSPGTFPVVQH